ncbi:winged helix-turn-helix domain-containing protein [Noviherbaspirillum pedocola]|uniref:Winged helix-turn-helix domain-containing protein n=1 Tax=Noviherbaspirillum pedocola TaxID=2801341 RepID=A0A934SY49_9BURK|nr:winged helix-turn-helix domain-containing protein [Noviherbaspirillum pedocola]MBK4737887.1 winged helix-turn-helix domain-containing protein [Noviherbaspirillum pedocola]
MRPRQRPADIYLRFLQLTDSIRELPMLPALDPLEERMLQIIARMDTEGGRLSVRDMMARAELGAPATIHTRLKSMREKGWIALADTEDMRRKQIELTQAALLYFDKLSGCLIEAASHER